MKLKLVPQIPKGYTATPGNSTLRVELEGGAGRYRRDVLNPSARVEVNWTLNAEQYTYLMAFYRGTLFDGSRSFTIDLAIFESQLKEYTVYFVPDTLQLNGQAGPLFFVSATLEALVTPADIDALTLIVSSYNSSHP